MAIPKLHLKMCENILHIRIRLPGPGVGGDPGVVPMAFLEVNRVKSFKESQGSVYF